MLFPKTWLKYSVPILFAGLALILAGYFYVTIREDEAWIGEQAYWLYKDGYAHSVLWQGYHNLEERVVFQHYLFTRLTAGLLFLLPWHIYTLRLIPLAGGLLVAGFIYLFVRKVFLWPEKQARLAAIVFILFPLTSEYLTYYRPEFLVTAMGFGSFWLLYRRHHHFLAVSAAGVLTGFAMMTHLNGVVFAFAGGILLLLGGNWKGFLIYSGTTCLGFLPYLFEIINHAELFFYQLSSGANSGGNNIKWDTLPVNLLNEHKRWFRGPYTIFTSILIIASSWVLYRSQNSGIDRRFVVYTILLVLGMGLFAVSKTSQYSILYYPQFAILITAALVQATQNPQHLQKPFKVFYNLCWGLFTVIAAGVLVYPFFLQQPNVPKINAALAKEIPAGSRVLGSMSLIFNQVDQLEVMGLAVPYELNRNQLSIEELAVYCREKQVNYVVLSPLWKKRLSDFDKNQEALTQHFELLKAVDEVDLYRLR